MDLAATVVACAAFLCKYKSAQLYIFLLLAKLIRDTYIQIYSKV
jgi:hypothetical protein